MLERFATEDETVLEASPDLVEFHRLVLKRFPPLEEVPPEKLRDPSFSPWSQTPTASDRYVGMGLRLDTPRKVFDEILALGKRFHLIVYDHQPGDLRRL